MLLFSLSAVHNPHSDEGGHSTEEDEEGGAWGKCIVGFLSLFASLIVNTNVCNGVWCMSVRYRLSIID